jgi:uncharacterized protein (DUF608 family)
MSPRNPPLQPRFDEKSGAYLDGRARRGFPLGGIGSGGVCINTDGSFGELRSNNNWMSPLRDLRGSFFALLVRPGGDRAADRSATTKAPATTHLLRLPWHGSGDAARPDEYDGAENVATTTFLGRLPAFSLVWGGLPIDLRLDGCTPLVPGSLRDSTLPAAILRFSATNTLAEEAVVALLFAFENPLGRGGTGTLGVELGPECEMRGVVQRVVYDSSDGARQEAAQVGARVGLRLGTAQVWPERSHRRSVTGEYLILAEAGSDLEVTICEHWNAAATRSAALDDFAREGRLGRDVAPPALATGALDRRGDGGSASRPAGAIAVRTTLLPGASREIAFALSWWTADHVTDASLARGAAALGSREPEGVRVGHVYENHHRDLDALAAEVLDRRDELEDRSRELGRILDRSSLPLWLVRALENSVDSVVCNTVVPRSGRLYTLEGVDWHWPMGGLTGTNDQRLSAHPYTSVFYPELDLSELDEFRRLRDPRGAVPHGNGNCDLGLGTTDVPYGWPMFIRDFLPAKEWTDLTMSLVLQVGKHWRMSGRREILDRFWPDLVAGLEYLDSIAPHGVPEGGTTYDIWDFPGVFAYTASLYVATLAMMRDLSPTAEPARADLYARRLAIASARLEELWDGRGFYRSTRERDTIFTAALAGDWIARYAGLDPVVPTERARTHLRAQHACSSSRRSPTAPRPDSSPCRAPRRASTRPRSRSHAGRSDARRGDDYVWQVVSYQACAQIYVGLVDEGLAAIKSIVDRVWTDGKRLERRAARQRRVDLHDAPGLLGGAERAHRRRARRAAADALDRSAARWCDREPALTVLLPRLLGDARAGPGERRGDDRGAARLRRSRHHRAHPRPPSRRLDRRPRDRPHRDAHRRPHHLQGLKATRGACGALGRRVPVSLDQSRAGRVVGVLAVATRASGRDEANHRFAESRRSAGEEQPTPSPRLATRAPGSVLDTSMPTDRDEIVDLLYSYAERLDAGDFEAVDRDCSPRRPFRSDRRPEVRRGRDEVLAVYRSTVATHEDGTPSTKHVTTNAIVEIEPGGAAARRARISPSSSAAELPLQPIVAGRYHDRFVKRDGRWRFADRLVRMDLIGDLRFHLKRDPTA